MDITHISLVYITYISLVGTTHISPVDSTYITLVSITYISLVSITYISLGAITLWCTGSGYRFNTILHSSGKLASNPASSPISCWSSQSMRGIRGVPDNCASLLWSFLATKLYLQEKQSCLKRDQWKSAKIVIWCNLSRVLLSEFAQEHRTVVEFSSWHLQLQIIYDEPTYFWYELSPRPITA